MTFFGPRKPKPADAKLTEQRLDAATRHVPFDEGHYQLQEVFLALYHTFRRHMTEEQFKAAQEEFTVLVKANQWEAFFRPPGGSPGMPPQVPPSEPPRA